MKAMIALSLGLFMALAAGVWLHQTRNQKVSFSTAYTNQETASPSSQASALPQPRSESHQHEMMARVPAYHRTPPNSKALPPTMRPEVFEGNVRLAYQVAKEIPQTLAQVPCYCHCDRGQGHKSLHTCFVDEHGANCGICIGEALMAYRLEKEQRLSADQIRERIIRAYGKSSER